MRAFIGLSGLKESGKTTTFNIIKDIIHTESLAEVYEVTLAKRLKDACSEVLGVPRNAFDDQKLKELELKNPVFLTRERIEALIKCFGYTPDFDKHVRQHMGVILDSARRVAQYVGTEVLRNVDTDIHCVGATMNLPEHGLFIVTDMRFPSEFDYFSNFNNFFPYYISNYAAESKLGPHSHESETLVLQTAKRCEKIENNSTLEDLRKRVKSVLEHITGNLKTGAKNVR